MHHCLRPQCPFLTGISCISIAHGIPCLSATCRRSYTSIPSFKVSRDCTGSIRNTITCQLCYSLSLVFSGTFCFSESHAAYSTRTSSSFQRYVFNLAVLYPTEAGHICIYSIASATVLQCYSAEARTLCVLAHPDSQHARRLRYIKANDSSIH